MITPLVMLQHLASQRIQLNFHIDVVGFGDEEGTRFGSTLLGSSAVAGVWDSSWADLTDDSGTTLANAFIHFGLDVNNISDAAITSNEVIAYIEAHIEQGPILEDTNQSLAPVKGIAGAKRYDISLTGHAGHAGTVPMNMRNDPLVVAAQWISEVYLQACELNQQENNVVATVGKIDVSPGAVNVIPGEVHLSLDVRSLDNALRDRLIDTLKVCLDNLAESNHLNLEWKQTHHADAVACNEGLTSLLGKAIDSVQGSSSSLVSGAGHDAMVFAGKVPTAMMFVRCKKGISHHPLESIAVEDATKAIQALMSSILAIQCDSNVESSNDSSVEMGL
ncbi:Zn-dependent hydrolase [Vibrio sp. M260118]|uniref:Zn-dependent hydrolase n=1 Tax=Vibrio sp. M260118 TaxID=3020896 RepID=UPI002F3F5E0D